MKVGVVGDIHGSYESLKEAVREMGIIDHLIFTGDGIREINRLQDETGLFVRGVRGNCDFLSGFPNDDLFHLDNYKVFLTHGHIYDVKSGLTRLAKIGDARGAQLVIFGHTHIPESTTWNNVMLFNPGTLYRERSYGGISFGMIEIVEGKINLSHHRIA